MVNHMVLYTCKEEVLMVNKIKRVTEIVKELLKLLEQIEKLTIRIISLLGWILIIILLLK